MTSYVNGKTDLHIYKYIYIYMVRNLVNFSIKGKLIEADRKTSQISQNHSEHKLIKHYKT